MGNKNMKQHQPMRLLFLLSFKKKQPITSNENKNTCLSGLGEAWNLPPQGNLLLALPEALFGASQTATISGKSLQTNGDLNPQMLHGTDIYIIPYIFA